MKHSLTALLISQAVLTVLSPAQIRLNSDPSTPGSSNGNIVLADFNHDGIPDVATSNYNGQTLTIKLGQGNGFFQTSYQQPISGGGFLFSADVNRDGKLDLIAVAAAGISTVATIGVSFGNGDGTFLPQVITALPFIPASAAVGNLNTDGVPDVVVANGLNALLPLLGAANGTFTPTRQIASSGLCNSLAIADFNKDGKADLIATCNGAQIYFGNGDGTFGLAKTIAPTGQYLAVADFNNDGNLDVAVSYNLVLSIYLNSGAGTFAQSYQSDQSAGYFGLIYLGDVNGDGKLDVLTPNPGGNLGLNVTLGKGDGTLQNSYSAYSYSGQFAQGAYVGDFNKDGIPDILVSAQDALCVLTGIGGGNFLQPTFPQISPLGFGGIGASADFNHDGLSDLVFFGTGGKNGELAQLKVALSNGDGTFTASPTVLAQDNALTASPFGVAVGDLNGDGNPDIVYVSSNMHLQTALSAANGSFQPALTVSTVPGSYSFGTVVADFTDDGKLDVAVLVGGTNSGGNNYLAIELFPGKGDGTVGSPVFTTLNSGYYYYNFSLVVGDFNGDGHPDLAALNNNNLFILTNSGSGAFHTTFRAATKNAFAIAAGDINNDGFTDLLKRSHAELDSFAYIASHDLKEPLRGIHNYAEMIREDYADRLDEEGKSRLATVSRLSHRMDELIDSLLEYSRVGASKFTNTDVDLNRVLSDALDFLQARIKDEAVQVCVHGPLPAVQGDYIRLVEVFANLISNAIKYNDKPRKEIEIGVDKSGAEASPVIYVRDNGIGIQEKHYPQIFEIFRRLHGRNDFGGGSGAGLTIIKKIIERHGGRIWLDSTVGRGTSFYFTLAQDSASRENREVN